MICEDGRRGKMAGSIEVRSVITRGNIARIGNKAESPVCIIKSNLMVQPEVVVGLA